MKKIITISVFAFYLNTNAQTLCFNTPTTFTTGATSTAVINADFNADGFQDLVTVNDNYGGGTNVLVLLGDGTGSFGPITSFTVGSGPHSITSADFNGDGKMDLATANETSNNVSVLLGTGTGSFGSATNFSVSANPRSITSADFNGDGKKDLATANFNSNNVSILLGTGTGSFGAATNFAAGTLPSSIVSSDFNGDGKKDLAVADYGTSGFGTTICVLLGTGTGSFGAPTNHSVGTGPISITSADFNSDGKADLAVANVSTYNVSVLLGTGSGSFNPTVTYPVGPGGSGPYSVTSGDFNLDGKLDLATANNGYPSVGILLNAGNGTFGSATQFTAMGFPSSVISADFNGDGKADVATDFVKVMLNCTALDITNFHTKQEVTIYPNPSNSNFTIETNATEKQTVTVFDVTGKIVLSQTISGTTSIDAGKLTEGIYNINIVGFESVINKRIVIAK